MGDIIGSPFEFRSIRHKSRIYTTAPCRLAKKFDTLLSVRAPVGDVNMAFEKCCIGRGLAAIQSDYSSFIFYTMKKLKKILNVCSQSFYQSMDVRNFNHSLR